MRVYESLESNNESPQKVTDSSSLLYVSFPLEK